MCHPKQVNPKDTNKKGIMQKHLNLQDIVLSALIYPLYNIRENCIIKHNNISPKTIAVAIKDDRLVIASGKILNCPKWPR